MIPPTLRKQKLHQIVVQQWQCLIDYILARCSDCDDDSDGSDMFACSDAHVVRLISGCTKEAEDGGS